jgi:hypothetical protein
VQRRAPLDVATLLVEHQRFVGRPHALSLAELGVAPSQHMPYGLVGLLRTMEDCLHIFTPARPHGQARHPGSVRAAYLRPT